LIRRSRREAHDQTASHNRYFVGVAADASCLLSVVVAQAQRQLVMSCGADAEWCRRTPRTLDEQSVILSRISSAARSAFQR
jgi:hypothetical protein